MRLLARGLGFPVSRSHSASVVGPADPTVRCLSAATSAPRWRRRHTIPVGPNSLRSYHLLYKRRRTLRPCPSPRCIPKLKTNHVKYPQGWELTEPTL
ncbi:unnamed protein product [Musa acuminata var. zebrina]